MTRIVFSTWHGPLPPHYVEVHRWADAAEIELWRASPSHIPLGLRGDRVYVTIPNTPRPGGVGAYRIEFAVPSAMLAGAGHDNWRQIFGPVGNTPILNLRILLP